MNAQREELTRCFSCGGHFLAIDGPTHDYMLSTPGCWAAFGRVLTREYEDAALFGAIHRLTVDAYALQHPGKLEDKRAVQSVWVHYAALHVALKGDVPYARIPTIMQRLAGKTFPSLPRGPDRFTVTHASVLDWPLSEHKPRVRAWARSAYVAWEALHDPTISVLKAL